MTLTLNPSTSIRPLGEEHLRMFRRMTQEKEVVPRVTLPKKALAGPKLELTKIEVTIDEAERIAKEMGRRLPTLKEVISAIKYDLGLYEALRDTRIWTSTIGIELRTGICKINYAKGTLEEISSDEWEKLPLMQKGRAWQGDRPVAVDCFHDIINGNGTRLIDFGGSYLPHVPANVAFVRDDLK